MSAQNFESKYASETSCVDDLAGLGISFEVPKLTKRHTLKLVDFVIDLYKSDAKNVLFRIEAHNKEDKWAVDLTAEHLTGQSCKAMICEFPELFERLFKLGDLVHCARDDLTLKLEGDIMAVDVVLKKVTESTEKIMQKQSMKIAALEKKHDELAGELTAIGMNVVSLSEMIESMSRIIREQSELIRNLRTENESIAKRLEKTNIELRNSCTEREYHPQSFSIPYDAL